MKLLLYFSNGRHLCLKDSLQSVKEKETIILNWLNGNGMDILKITDRDNNIIMINRCFITYVKIKR